MHGGNPGCILRAYRPWIATKYVQRAEIAAESTPFSASGGLKRPSLPYDAT